MLRKHHGEPLFFSVATCQSQSARFAYTRRPLSKQLASAMLPVAQRTSVPACYQNHLAMGVAQLLALQGWVATLLKHFQVETSAKCSARFEIRSSDFLRWSDRIWGPSLFRVTEVERRRGETRNYKCLCWKVSPAAFAASTRMFSKARLPWFAPNWAMWKQNSAILKVGRCCSVSASNCASVSSSNVVEVSVTWR